MTGAFEVILRPDLPFWALGALIALGALLLLIAGLRGVRGLAPRVLVMVLILLALARPMLRSEERVALPDIALMLVDDSASQSLAPRPDQTAAAVAALRAEAQRAGLRLVEARLGDDADNRGTLLLGALERLAVEHPPERIAGAVLISDGQITDAEALTAFPAPVHLLQTGLRGDWDQRLVVDAAPSYGIIGESVEIRVTRFAEGAVPEGARAAVPLSVQVDGTQIAQQPAPHGETLRISVPLTHGGQNLVEIQLPEAPGELTHRNNRAVVAIHAVRDRLRVLLVSGEPHPGGRAWRNLLKSDPSVDLVHFTILRPPHKQDGVPVTELSLIAFPTHELFMERIDAFDLIIFDRYRRRGVLPLEYLDNIVRYVEEGGAVLIAAGPAFAGAESLARSPLARILPVVPTARLIDEAFQPVLSPEGLRHPVTAPLAEGAADWGRWMLLIETVQRSGQGVMTGADGQPLLVLDRPGAGRIAVLASDQAWLWTRGVEGGGPAADLLRRLAHWLMREPELEEEVLGAQTEGTALRITRRSMADSTPPVALTLPDGTTREMTLAEDGPGQFSARLEAAGDGLYRLAQGDLHALAIKGPAAAREYAHPLASTAPPLPLIAASGGGRFALEEGMPVLRTLAQGRVAHGRGWLGLYKRGAYDVTGAKLTPLMPRWLLLALIGLSMLWVWRRESR